MGTIVGLLKTCAIAARPSLRVFKMIQVNSVAIEGRVMVRCAPQRTGVGRLGLSLQAGPPVTGSAQDGVQVFRQTPTQSSCKLSELFLKLRTLLVLQDDWHKVMCDSPFSDMWVPHGYLSLAHIFTIFLCSCMLPTSNM